MSLEAALNLSVPDLLRVLNDKLHLECTRVREIPLPPVLASIITLRAEVSTPLSISQQTRQWDLMVNPPDRKSRSQGTRCSESHPVVTEPITTCEQASARDPLSDRPIHG